MEHTPDPAASQHGPSQHGFRRAWSRISGSPRRAVPIAVAVALVAAGLVPGVAAVGTAAAEALGAPGANDYTQFVDPFVSTEDDYGQDMPGAMAPHGLAKLNPMTTPGRSHSGYNYAEDQIAGFTATNLDGVGGSGAGGDLLTVPTYVQYTGRPATSSYAKNYSHDDEDATPGYYRVALGTTQGTDGSVSNTPGSAPIEAEMTADVRTAFQRYTFPNAGPASLVLDLRNNYTGRLDAGLDTTVLDDGRASFSGFVAGTFNGANYRLYYYAETTEPVKGVRTWGNDGVLGAATSQHGTDIGAIIDVDVTAGDIVELKTTLSPISTAQAKTDMANEIGDRGFDAVRDDTAAAWNQVLGTVAVDSSVTSDPDGTLKQLFYTHLYRLFSSPVNATSTTGTYRGADGVIYQADGYTHYDGWGLWDDFRKQSILAIAFPDVYHDVTQSLVDLFAEFANTSAGSITALEQSVPSVRYERASVVVADAVSKGVDLKGLDLAFAGLKKHVGGGYNPANTVRGYIADQVGDTLGTAYDDWAMSVIADALGDADDKAFYLNRATNYTNVFNKDAWTNLDGVKVGMMYPKDGNGNWWNNVNPEQFEAANLYQGTLWQYNWYVANDMGGMIDLMGGQENAQSAVDYMFGEQAPDDGSRMLHSNANEIDLQAPYLFNFVGQPSHTQYWARSIYTKPTWNRYIATGSVGQAPTSGGEFRPPIKDKVFELDSDGFLPSMDNDTGMMSATFVAAAMGLFPATAGSDSYQIGSPFFEHVTIDGHNGKTFSINADDVSPDRFYIQSATLNGASLDRTWITNDEIMAGGDVTFQMGDTASEWAADGPMAYTMSDHVDSAVYDRARTNPVSSSSKVFAEATANDGTIGNTITLSATGTTFAGAVGDDLAGSAVTAVNVPDGLALHAIKRSDTSLELSLSGSARIHLPSDDIDDLAVTLAGSAFATAVNGAAQTIDLKVAYSGYSLVADKAGVTADESGAVTGTVSLTVQGGATFAEASGDLIAAGTARVDGLPAGLSATLVRQDATTLALAVSGTLQAVEAGTFTIGFDDAALAGGVTASEITGDGLSALHPLTISVGSDWRDKLAALYADVHLVQQGNYSPQSFAVLTSALEKAKAALDNPAASDVALQQAYFTVQSAVDALELGEGGFRRLEGERSDAWSGGELKNEAINLGGVKPDSWVEYKGMDFSAGAPARIDIRYVANATRTPADSAVEIHVDAPDGPLAGTVPLPNNSPDWNNYTTATYTFTDPTVLADASSVFFVFRGTVTGNLPWVANLDYFQFVGANTAPDTFDRLTTRNATELHPGIDRSLEMFQNVNNAEWARYRDYDFGDEGVDKLLVNYDKPVNGTPESTAVEVHFGSIDSPAVATVALEGHTGDNWGSYRTATIDVDPTVFVGVKDVYFVFTIPTPDAGGRNPYIANIPWMQFVHTGPEAPTSFHLEAESFAASSGGDLGVENNTDPSGVGYTNLKGTHNNDWLRYDGVDFGEQTATSVTVRYVNNSSRCGANSRVEVYLDSRDGAPFTTVPLPVTGNAWSAINTTTVDLPSGITGAHTIFLVLRTEPNADHPYVANIDWFDFGYGVDASPLRAAIEKYAPLMDEEGRYLAVDFRTFRAAFESAEALAEQENITRDELAEALRTLNLSAGQLEWKVVRQLGELIPQAEAVDPALYTPESYAPLAAATARAKALTEDASYEEYQEVYGELRTAYESLGLVVPPEPGRADEQLQVTIPEAGSGEFVWNIDGGNGLVDLGTAVQGGDHFAAAGAINAVRVTDTRVAAPQWSISAQVGDFTSGGDTFSGKYLGWTPRLLEAGGGAAAGVAVASGFESGDGLSASSTLGSAGSGHALGSAILGADLDLRFPLEVADGTYQATLTLTALG